MTRWRMLKAGTFFFYAKLNVCLFERANVGNWIIQWARFAKSTLCPLDHTNWNACDSTCSYVRCSILPFLIWIEQTIHAYFILDAPINLTTNCRAAIVTRNRFLTRNIRHTNRFSDSREKRDAAREKRETSQEKRDSSRKKRDERW